MYDKILCDILVEDCILKLYVNNKDLAQLLHRKQFCCEIAKVKHRTNL